MNQKSYDLDKVYTVLRPLGEKTIFISIPAEKKQDARPVQKTKPIKKPNKTFFYHTWDFTKQLAFSAFIFAMLFLIMNWSAYSKIFQVKFDKARGIAQTNVMQEFAAPKIAPKQTLLEVSKNPEVEKKNIPYFSLAVTPPDTRLIIPRINKNIPIIQVSDDALLKRNFDALEKDIQEGLKDGVINYPGTSKPGERGNVVITGHSSYFPWKAGRFKDVFAILEEVKEGDKIAMFHKQKKYIYEVYKTEVVSPKNIEPLKQTAEDILTLITCVPIGTDLNRLIIKAKLISTES